MRNDFPPSAEYLATIAMMNATIPRAAPTPEELAWAQKEAAAMEKARGSYHMEGEEVYRLFGATSYEDPVMVAVRGLKFPPAGGRMVHGRSRLLGGTGTDHMEVIFERHLVRAWLDTFAPVAEAFMRHAKKAR